VVLLAAGLCAAMAATTFAQERSFAWYGELVSTNPAAKAITVKAQIAQAAAKYAAEHKGGDHIVLIWDINGAKGGEADTILAVATPEDMKMVDVGYVARVDFVSADAAAKTLTFTATVPDAVLKSLSAAQPGKWIKVTSPMAQPGPGTAMTAAMALAEKPAPLPPRPKPPEPPAGGSPSGRGGRGAAAAAAVKANGGISGGWTLSLSIGGNDLKSDCELAQDGPKLGGTCKTPAGDAAVTGGVTGPKVTLQYTANLAGMDIEFVYNGTLDEAGKKMTGSVSIFGMDAEFTGTKH
jgi:hypothetical protein